MEALHPGASLIESVVLEIRKELGNELVGVILVGSAARGDYAEDSDVDLQVIVRDGWGAQRRHASYGGVVFDMWLRSESLIGALLKNLNVATIDMLASGAILYDPALRCRNLIVRAKEQLRGGIEPMKPCDIWFQWHNCHRLLWIAKSFARNDNPQSLILLVTILCEVISLTYPIAGLFHPRPKRLFVEAPWDDPKSRVAFEQLLSKPKSLFEIIEETPDIIDSVLERRRRPQRAEVCLDLVELLASRHKSGSLSWHTVAEIVEDSLGTKPVFIQQYSPAQNFPTFFAPHVQIIIESKDHEPHTYFSCLGSGLQLSIGTAETNPAGLQLKLAAESREEALCGRPFFDPWNLQAAMVANSRKSSPYPSDNEVRSLKQAPLTLLQDARSMRTESRVTKIALAFLSVQGTLRMLCTLLNVPEPTPAFVFMTLRNLEPNISKAARAAFESIDVFADAHKLAVFIQRSYNMVGGHSDEWIGKREPHRARKDEFPSNV